MLNFDNLARRFLENANGTIWMYLVIQSALVTPITDAPARMAIVTEIRDNIEVVHSPEYGSFLTYMFPVFYNVLRQGIIHPNLILW